MIANVYEINTLINSFLNKEVSNNCLKKILSDLMLILQVFIPHLASECLEKLECKNRNEWPKVDLKLLKNQKIKFAIQINGKTRDIIDLVNDTSKEEVVSMCMKSDKVSKHLKGKKPKKLIFVKNKIINFLV